MNLIFHWSGIKKACVTGTCGLYKANLMVLAFLPGAILPIRNLQTGQEPWMISSCLCFRESLDALEQ